MVETGWEDGKAHELFSVDKFYCLFSPLPVNSSFVLFSPSVFYQHPSTRHGKDRFPLCDRSDKPSSRSICQINQFRVPCRTNTTQTLTRGASFPTLHETYVTAHTHSSRKQDQVSQSQGTQAPYHVGCTLSVCVCVCGRYFRLARAFWLFGLFVGFCFFCFFFVRSKH